MNPRIIQIGKTQRRIDDTSPMQPRIDPADIARALGAEVVGPTSERSGTFAAMRARAAACLVKPSPASSSEEKINLDPALQKTLDRLSDEFRAEGLQITASELAQRLLQISVAEADADSKATLAKLRSRDTGPGGQPT